MTTISCPVWLTLRSNYQDQISHPPDLTPCYACCNTLKHTHIYTHIYTYTHTYTQAHNAGYSEGKMFLIPANHFCFYVILSITLSFHITPPSACLPLSLSLSRSLALSLSRFLSLSLSFYLMPLLSLSLPLSSPPLIHPPSAHLKIGRAHV